MASVKGKPIAPGETRWVGRGLFARCSRDGRKVRYGISFLEGGKRRQQIVADTLTEARTALEARRTDVGRGEYRHEPRNRSTTFAEYAAGYLKQAANEKRTVRRDDLAVRAALPFLGGKPVDRIDPSDIRDFAQARLEGRCSDGIKRKHDRGLSKSTVNRDLAVIKHILQRAVDDGFARENPGRKVKLFRVQERDRRVLSEVEERRLLAAAAPHLGPLLVVALNTGLRRSELTNLDWSDVDFETGYLFVRRQTKSYKNRNVPLNDAARDTLRKLPGPRVGHVFRFKGDSIEDVKKSMRSAVTRAEIAHSTLHTCRHTFATRLVMAGVPLPTVQRLLGHASITTTMRYAHPAPVDLVNAVNILNKGTEVDDETGHNEAGGDTSSG